MPKPGDFYVGVLEFFSILLPGAALVALLAGTGLLRDVEAMLPLRGPAERYAAFLLGAYAAGHIVFLLSALLDESVYSHVRKRVWPDRPGDAYDIAGQMRRAAVGGDDKLPMNTFSWAKSYLMLHWPAAWSDVQRYEADSKFFRSLTLLLALAAPLLAADGETGMAAISLALSAAACWRYAERRYKATQWAYQHVVVHHAGRPAAPGGPAGG